MTFSLGFVTIFLQIWQAFREHNSQQHLREIETSNRCSGKVFTKPQYIVTMLNLELLDKGQHNRKGEKRVAAAKPMTLQERILQIDHIQARRYAKLTDDTMEIATEGIIRHLRACVRMDVNPDASAVREIIDDAINGRRVFAETSNDLLAA